MKVFPELMSKLNTDNSPQSLKTIEDHILYMEERIDFAISHLRADYITAGKIDAEYLNITGAITFDDLDSDVKSRIEQAGGALTLSVENGEDRSYIKLMKDGIVISSQTIMMDGMVTFTSLETPGMTVIDGSNISTGTIAAERLELTDYVRIEDLATGGATVINGANISTGTISAERVDLTGYVTTTDLATGGSTTINGANITTGTISAERLDLTGYVTTTDLSTGGRTTINGSNITTGTIDASKAAITNLVVKNANIESLNASKITCSGQNIGSSSDILSTLYTGEQWYYGTSGGTTYTTHLTSTGVTFQSSGSTGIYKSWSDIVSSSNQAVFG